MKFTFESRKLTFVCHCRFWWNSSSIICLLQINCVFILQTLGLLSVQVTRNHRTNTSLWSHYVTGMKFRRSAAL